MSNRVSDETFMRLRGRLRPAEVREMPWTTCCKHDQEPDMMRMSALRYCQIVQPWRTVIWDLKMNAPIEEVWWSFCERHGGRARAESEASRFIGRVGEPVLRIPGHLS
jgi:hypothetical protein